jgi:ceramide glucosyltransferase
MGRIEKTGKCMLSLIINIYIYAIGASLIYLLINALVTRKAFTERRPDLVNETDWPGISILKPVKGIDDRFEENLRSFFNLDYPKFEIIFGLHDSSDPAMKLLEKLKSEFKSGKVKIIINRSEIGLNPKINNLNNMYPHAVYDTILISDSNTQVKPDYLKNMACELKNSGTGLVTSTVRGIGAGNLASSMENLHLNTFVTPNVLSAFRLFDKPIVIGKAMLIRRKVLEGIGVFFAFRNYLAEDYLMGAAVKKLGYNIKNIPAFVNNVNENWTLERFLNRHTRWAKMRRHMHLVHYILESMSNPVAMSFILGILMFNVNGLIQFGVVSLLKQTYDLYISRILNSDLKWYQYPAGILKDLVIGVIWFVPFFSYKVEWRDNYLKIRKDSFLEPAYR